VLIVFIFGETYLVTKDIVPTLERKIGITLSPFLREKIRILEDCFINELWRYIPEKINKISIDASTTSNELEVLIKKSNLPIISLDRVYLNNANEYLETTRITDQNTGEMTIASRPGNPSLEEQISKIKKYSEIGLVDVGAFGGDTLLEVCDLFEDNKINIEEIFLGYSDTKTNEKISKTRKVSTLNLFEFYEWIELRDLFGIDGRRIANQTDCFIPYWENLTEWANIAPKYEEQVKDLCKNYNNKLLGLLTKEDVKKIGKPVSYGGIR
jgi:hypothetical protein